MREAQKTNALRDETFFSRFLFGRVIDIGAGDDVVVPNAERFDVEDGDANQITRYRTREAYDSVHSCHCLEHMTEPRKALAEWWALVKPGGHLVLVVPDEDLYEQHIWPSAYNLDHKATFNLRKGKSWSPVSYNVADLVASLPGAEVISADVQDHGFDYTATRAPNIPAPIVSLRRLVFGIPFFGVRVLRRLDPRIFSRYPPAKDQTYGQAVAQIQVVARKSLSS